MSKNCDTTPNNNSDKEPTSTSTSTRIDRTASSNRKCVTKPFITSLMVFGRKVSLYVKPEDYQEYLLFKELAKMERMTLGRLAEVALVEYARRHHPGNPQLPLSKFGVKKKITQSCVYPNCSEAVAFEDISNSGEKLLVCKRHHESAKKRRLLKGWKQL